MKGVIVQTGEPKSIVLFNNGKISAIPTPADCHVGMVVTVKFNNKLKILIITLAAVLLVAIGVFIGVSLAGGRAAEFPPAEQAVPAVEDDGTEDWQRGQKKMQKIRENYSP
jgi:hypothetical protein